MMAVFRRRVYQHLLDWKNEDAGSTAALIEGARRVGKTTIATQFGSNEYRSYLKIDFSSANPQIMEIFEEHSYDLDDFFARLEFETKTHFHVRDTLIIFDEVQFYPKARQMIKRLVADGRYDYLETGSLISVKENVKDILIPSEETIIRMYPMDFEEFLWALGDDITVDRLKVFFESREPLGRKMHEKIMAQYRIHMLLGGMPQVIDRYLNDKSFRNIERVKKDILSLYRSDLLKLPGNLSSRALLIFDQIPSLLSSKKKVFAPAKVKRGSRVRDYDRAMKWLSEAMIILPCRCQNDPSVVMRLDIDESRIKPYLLDTGLLTSLAFGNDGRQMEQVYENLLRGKLSVNEGMFFENTVAQELMAHGHELFFSEFKTKDSTSLYEVDFLIPGLNRISPVEVKSASSSRHASLDAFISKYGRRTERPVVIHTKDLREADGILYIPVYMTMFLRRRRRRDRRWTPMQESDKESKSGQRGYFPVHLRNTVRDTYAGGLNCRVRNGTG